MNISSASPDEIARFTAMADAWWDPEGDFKPLHKINPVRLIFLKEKLLAHFQRDPSHPRPFTGLRLLDAGCGGGLLTEPMAEWGFTVTAIDAGEKNIAVAQLHAAKSGLSIDYRVQLPEKIPQDEMFDVILSMEVVEHVPDVKLFLNTLSRHLNPGGAFFAATLNRTARSWAEAVIAAEYILRWLPAGTHTWQKFVTPAEFTAALRVSGIEVKELVGLGYSLLKDTWKMRANLDVNYLLYGEKSI